MKTNKNAKSLNQIGGHARQGDVLLRRINNIPKGLKKCRPTLAYGEVSNHHHSFEGDGATCFADDEKALADFAQVTKEAPLTHQEHSTIRFPAGNYEKLYQVEDTSKEVRPVQD